MNSDFQKLALFKTGYPQTTLITKMNKGSSLLLRAPIKTGKK
jgi:hypothetical protein